MYADDERTREVGQTCSTCEVLEQGWATGGGGDGGKRFGQGKSATAKRVPDSEPDRRAQCAGADRQAASKDKEMRFTALSHHIYAQEALRTAYRYLKREAAPGVDGETWRHYSTDNITGRESEQTSLVE